VVAVNRKRLKNSVFHNSTSDVYHNDTKEHKNNKGLERAIQIPHKIIAGNTKHKSFLDTTFNMYTSVLNNKPDTFINKTEEINKLGNRIL